MAKFGWTPDSGSGLGANGDGRLAHISVAQKLNLLGIGGPTAGANDPDALAWKQNREFESVLKRLNGEEEEKMNQALLHGFVPGEITESTIEEQQEATREVLGEKEEKRRRKEERRRRKQALAEGDSSQTATPPEESPASTKPTTLPKSGGMGPRMAYVIKPSSYPLFLTQFLHRHRAKFRASKQMASLSSAALSEILGVANSSGSTTPNTNSLANQGASTPSLLERSVPNKEVVSHPTGREDQLKTSTTSVADYFAAKMKARQQQVVPEAQTPVDVEMISPEDDEKREKKEKKKRKRAEAVENAEDTMMDEVDVAVVSDEKPKRRKEKEPRESKRRDEKM